jgi:RNA polymerase sigma factor (sigma-70 family)
MAATVGTSARPPAYDLLADERLATLAGRGDRQAGAAIHERYADVLLGYVRSIVRDPDDAQDVLQQTMLNALQALARRDLEAPLRPWLFRIAHNTSISLLRRRRPSEELDDERSQIGQHASAETELLARERLRELVDDVAALPERQRVAILLHDVAGLPHELIAEELGCSGGASRQTVSAARSALRDAVAGREVPCAEVRELATAGDRRRLRSRLVQAHLRTCAGCGVLVAANPRHRALSGPSGWAGVVTGVGAAGTAGAPAVLSGAVGKAAVVLTVAATAAVGGAVGGHIAPPTRHVAEPPTGTSIRSTIRSAPTSPARPTTTDPASSAILGTAPSPLAVTRAAGRVGVSGQSTTPTANLSPGSSFGGRPHGALMAKGQSPTVDRVADRGRLRPTGVRHQTFGSGAWRRSQPVSRPDDVGGRPPTDSHHAWHQGRPSRGDDGGSFRYGPAGGSPGAGHPAHGPALAPTVAPSTSTPSVPATTSAETADGDAAAVDETAATATAATPGSTSASADPSTP